MTGKKRGRENNIYRKKKRELLDGIEVNCAYRQVVTLDKLQPHPDNPNEHPEEQLELLEKIIRAAGWRAPITVSIRSGLIIRGHARYLVAKRAGWNRVPVDYQDYKNEAEELADLLADNQIPELAKKNLKKMGAVILKLRAAELDLSLAALTAPQIEKILGKAEGAGKPEIEFTEEVLLAHNYVVLYFDNPFDWQVALEKFGLKHVKDLIPRKGQPVGIGRVVSGAKWLERIK